MGFDKVTPEMLCGMPLFSDLTDDHVGVIAGISSVRSVPLNQEIFHEGDKRDFLYVVLEGRVALEMHIPGRGRVRILTVEPNEVLGWSSVADVSPKRTLTARSVTPATLLAIDSEKLLAACKADCLLGYTVMHHIANVIANRLLVTRMQLLDIFAQSSAEAAHG